MSTRQFVTFWLGNDLFGIDILLVREINRHLDITQVDRAPKYVEGLLNLRGQIVTVIDLRTRLGLESQGVNASTGCIVLKPTQDLERLKINALDESISNDLAGLLVDKIGDVISAESEQIDPPPAHEHGTNGHFIEGVIKLQNCLLVILKTSAILSATNAIA